MAIHIIGHIRNKIVVALSGIIIHPALERISVIRLGDTYAHKTGTADRDHEAISFYRL